MKKSLVLVSIIGLSIAGISFAATKATTTTKAATVKTTAKAPAVPVKKVVPQKFDYAAWIPYWRKTEGSANAAANLTKLTQISPFNYELKLDGSAIIDDAGVINEEPWVSLIKDAKKKGIKVYPTILAYPHNDTEKNNLYLLMAQRASRNQHIQDILDTVMMNNFDGIDIDYEAKTAETREYFSDFLTKLSAELHKSNKQLICTVEARTPPESKFATTSPEVLQRIEYSNDYKAIGKACDQVRIMMYDQMNDDQVLVNQNSAGGGLYRPVADINWIKKVATLALEDIPAKKIIMGVATYGYKFEITPATATSSAKYSRIGSMNWNYADELAKSIGVIPTRNSAGELNFVYATSTGVNGENLGGMKQYLVWYSDSQAIADKIKIAKLYGLGGIAIFKIDGGFDPKLWSVLK